LTGSAQQRAQFMPVCKHAKLKTIYMGNNTFLIYTHTENQKIAVQQVSCSTYGPIVRLLSGAIQFWWDLKKSYLVVRACWGCGRCVVLAVPIVFLFVYLLCQPLHVTLFVCQ